MNNAEELLGTILDIGVEMIRSGAETHRVEDSLYRICSSYRFTRSEIWVVPTNIQATVTTAAGETVTQIRHVREIGIDFTRLEKLNALSRRICAKAPGTEQLREELDRAVTPHPQKRAFRYLAAALAAAGFGVFFHCDLIDALVAVAVSALITLLSTLLSRRETNPLILNFMIALAAELAILCCHRAGLGHHPDYITVGVVMLLISALGTTNGVRDLVHLDTLSGVVNISASFTGAIGIALGIAVPLMLLKDTGTADPAALNPSVALQLAACTFGCAGFALWFHVQKRHVPFCALGALITWAVYLAVSRYAGNFISILAGSAACALYAQIMARIRKCPATVFQTIAIFPLIPGATLYYMMYSAVSGNVSMSLEKAAMLLLTCFGIVLGFMTVEAAIKLLPKKQHP